MYKSYTTLIDIALKKTILTFDETLDLPRSYSLYQVGISFIDLIELVFFRRLKLFMRKRSMVIPLNFRPQERRVE